VRARRVRCVRFGGGGGVVVVGGGEPPKAVTRVLSATPARATPTPSANHARGSRANAARARAQLFLVARHARRSAAGTLARARRRPLPPVGCKLFESISPPYARARARRYHAARARRETTRIIRCAAAFCHVPAGARDGEIDRARRYVRGRLRRTVDFR